MNSSKNHLIFIISIFLNLGCGDIATAQMQAIAKDEVIVNKQSKDSIVETCSDRATPIFPNRAYQDGTTGKVRTQITIKNGQVIDINIISGPRVFHSAVKNAIMQYKCRDDETELTFSQDFDFLIPPPKEIALICPIQISPEYPARAIQDGISAKVKAQIKLSNGEVTDIKFISGPRIFYFAVKNAIMKYKCQSNDDNLIFIQEFDFITNENPKIYR